jgi:hypothetical protein
MKHINRLERTLLARGLLGLALAVGCGGATSATPVVGGETHFLRSCSESCDDGLACIGGICTRSCLVAEASCDDLATGATCTAASVEPGAVAVCDLACAGAGDCSALGSGYACDAGFCRAPALASLPPGASCPSFAAGVLTPTPIDSTARVIPGASDVQSAIVDDSGLYWMDRAGVIYALRPGASQAEQISAPPAAPFALTGFVMDDDNLYWGEAVQPLGPVEPGPPSPPGRLNTVSKAGGLTVELVQSETDVFAPLGVRNGQVVVEVQVGELGIFGVPIVGVQREPLRLRDELPSSARVLRGDDIYYLEGGEPPTLRRAPLDGGPSQPVRAIEGSEFALGPSTILWKKSTTTSDPLTLVESLVLLDEATGCVSDLPSLGETISIAGLDADHVYWKSYNGLGAFSPGDVPEALPLVRVNLRTGAFERLSTPGFDATVVTDYLTEDESALYFRVDGGIVAVQKP